MVTLSVKTRPSCLDGLTNLVQTLCFGTNGDIKQDHASADRRNIAIVYGSFDSGNSETAAMTIQSLKPASLAHLPITTKPPVTGNEFDFNALANCKYLIVVTSSRYGMPPPNLAQFAHQLLAASQNSAKPLAGLQHCVFGNGDPNYLKTYMNCPRAIDRLLEQAGSKRFCARGENNEPFAPLAEPNVGVIDWGSFMWQQCEVAEKCGTIGFSVVPWDALWAGGHDSEYHHNVKVFDSDEVSQKVEKMRGSVATLTAKQ